uniref:Uncharacterized protein n=1 Tax=Anophryoides haemophila TaxID=46462 RepID=A0A7S3IBW6_9CILI|mmetsp:Transcript_12411/g.1859  ORF Transcript_12411/g.1859 Transcript_12411/m.1859 type:complete len:194 (+) Transcript_12411:65-646(+)
MEKLLIWENFFFISSLTLEGKFIPINMKFNLSIFLQPAKELVINLIPFSPTFFSIYKSIFKFYKLGICEILAPINLPTSSFMLDILYTKKFKWFRDFKDWKCTVRSFTPLFVNFLFPLIVSIKTSKSFTYSSPYPKASKLLSVNSSQLNKSNFMLLRCLNLLSVSLNSNIAASFIAGVLDLFLILIWMSFKDK